MNRNVLVLGVISIFFVTSAWSETLSPDAVAVTAAVDGFHEALRRGDAKAAMELLAPDAVILESGAAETREEYERHHLSEDMEFAREVETARSVINVVVEGNAAWITATSQSSGSFHGRQINSSGTKLIVLTKSSSGWRIRAIHWSSRKITKPE